MTNRGLKHMVQESYRARTPDAKRPHLAAEPGGSDRTTDRPGSQRAWVWDLESDTPFLRF